MTKILLIISGGALLFLLGFGSGYSMPHAPTMTQCKQVFLHRVEQYLEHPPETHKHREKHTTPYTDNSPGVAQDE